MIYFEEPPTVTSNPVPECLIKREHFFISVIQQLNS